VVVVTEAEKEEDAPKAGKGLTFFLLLIPKAFKILYVPSLIEI
jgi:hypothetical protein